MRAVFLDRDGVLNACRIVDGRSFPPSTVAEFELYPEASEACSRLKRAGFALIVVTNQPDIGRGTQSVETVNEMHNILRQKLPLDEIYMCVHGNDDECDCRKPKPGMLVLAAREKGLQLEGSFMVGDRWRDIDCGNAAGCQTVFIDRHYDENLRQVPDAIVNDIGQAADWILSHELVSNLEKLQ